MRYSTSDLSRKSGDIIARALQGPITITQRGKPRLILMSVEEYNRLRAKQDRVDSSTTKQDLLVQEGDAKQVSKLGEVT